MYHKLTESIRMKNSERSSIEKNEYHKRIEIDEMVKKTKIKTQNWSIKSIEII